MEKGRAAQRRRRPAIGFVLTAAALLLLAAAPAGSIEARADGTVITKVRYRDSSGTAMPLAGVEVFLWDAGEARYACTDAHGKARFDGVTSDIDLWAATGVAVSGLGCANGEFLNPETNRPMYAVLWRNHHGTGGLDDFQVGSGETTRIKFRTRTPEKSKKVCVGFKVTIMGTPADDVLVGTGGRDVINGRGGDDVIMGMAGDDLICGELGHDELWGDEGDDWLHGGAGNDDLFGGPGVDRLDGAIGIDKCKTGEDLISCEK